MPRPPGPGPWAQYVPVASAVQAGLPTHIQFWSGVDNVLNIRPLVTAAHAWGTQWDWGQGDAW